MKKTYCPPHIFFLCGILSCWIFGFAALVHGEETLASPEESTPEPISLRGDLLGQSGEKVSPQVLEGKFVGLYFSASWCGPCRAFTPSLIKFREAHKENFEVVLIGADGSSKAQANYMKKYKMPWLALKNQSREATEIRKSLQVPHIPFLVILDPGGKIVSKNGRKEISRSGDDAFATWKKLPK